MFPFCDVAHDAKQKYKQTLESAQYGLEISFNPYEMKYRKNQNSIHMRTVGKFCFELDPQRYI